MTDGLLAALRAFLDAIGDGRDLIEVAGLAGLAFRLDVDDHLETCDGTPEAWAWTFAEAFARLELRVEVVVHDPNAPGFAAVQADLEQRLAAKTSPRWPALAFGLHAGGWGLVLGPDAGGGLRIAGPLPGGPTRLAPGRLGRGAGGLLCVAMPEEASRSDPSDRDAAALRHAAAALTGLAPRSGAIESGPGAWRAWRTALDAGTILPAGHAACAAITLQRRALGAAYVGRVAGRVPEAYRSSSRDPDVLDAVARAETALRDAQAALARGVDALAELSAAWPAPAAPDSALTASARASHGRLIEAARAADDAAARALLLGLAALDDARAGDLEVDRAPAAAALFACVDDLPFADLEREADELRPLAGTPRLAPIVLADHGVVVAHAHVADLAASGAAVEAFGPCLYLYCVWVAAERRGRGIGRRLARCLVEEARARGARAILVEATTQPVFLHHAGYEALGFVEVDRDGDDRRLLALVVDGGPLPTARLIPAPAPPPGRHLLVRVSAGRPCPLLLRSARNVAAAARACQGAGAPLDLEETTAPPHVIDVGDRRLPFGYVPEDAAREALVEASDAWMRGHDDRE